MQAFPFNRALHRLHRQRAATTFSEHGFLVKEAAARLADRLHDFALPFARTLILGGASSLLADYFTGHAKLRDIVYADFVFPMLGNGQRPALVMDAEYSPLDSSSLDAILCPWSLHWLNDLPGVLAQFRRALKPDGLLLAVMPGGATLQELRQCYAEIESADGRLSPHVAPFVDVRDAGMLLQRAGFALPVVDAEWLTITYPSVRALMRDLRGMGETNALNEQARGMQTPRKLLALESCYQERFGDDGRIPATVELVTMTGWAPAPTQQQPAKRGSGQIDLATFLKN